MENDNVKAICATFITKNNLKLFIINAYIPPNETDQLIYLINVINSADCDNVLITGNLNAKSPDWNNASGKNIEQYSILVLQVMYA